MPERQHKASADFWRAYHALPQDVRQRAEKQFELLRANPRHPSLQFKKIGERHGTEVWSARVTPDYRALAIQEAGAYLWFWVGDHKSYDGLNRLN